MTGGLDLGNGTSGYGNAYNVGFSPGQVGGLPAGINKFVYQQQLYQQMYGASDRATMARNPLSFAAVWTPFGLFLSYVIIVFAHGFSFNFGPKLMGWFAGSIIFVLVWVIALWLVYRMTIAVWLNALVLHRRVGGWLAPHLAWADQFNDTQKYAKYNENFGHYHPDPAVRERARGH